MEKCAVTQAYHICLRSTHGSRCVGALTCGVELVGHAVGDRSCKADGAYETAERTKNDVVFKQTSVAETGPYKAILPQIDILLLKTLSKKQECKKSATWSLGEPV